MQIEAIKAVFECNSVGMRQSSLGKGWTQAQAQEGLQATFSDGKQRSISREFHLNESANLIAYQDGDVGLWYWMSASAIQYFIFPKGPQKQEQGR